MMELLWITKTAESRSLSHSAGQEQLAILSQAQRISRRQRARAQKKVKKPIARLQNEIEGICSRSSVGFMDCVCCACTEKGIYYSQTSSPPTIECCFNSWGDWTPTERRSATFFREVSVYKILTLQRDHEFWQNMVPRTAEADPGIRHLVVAIAATHELLLQPTSNPLRQFALDQCNKALRSILASDNTNISVLLTSCILVSGYNLLQGDVEAADRNIESGLKMLSPTQEVKQGTDLETIFHVLMSLGKQHGFKLWTPDVTFRIDRTVAGRESMVINTQFWKGPFVDVQQVLTAFKTIMTENVAKPLRNLSLGAHIDPECMLARDISQNLSDIFYHWEVFYNSLSNDQADEKLEMLQVKIGLLSARVFFGCKIIESNEIRDNEFIQTYAEMADLGQQVIAALHTGQPVIYLDRIVNGALYPSSLFCRDPHIKRQIISLLKSQLVHADGLVNFLRGHVSDIVGQIEECGIVVKNCYDIPEEKRIRVCQLSCQEDRVFCLKYMKASQTDRLSPILHFSKLPPELHKFNTQEIDICLQGMTAAYSMYGKVDLPAAPQGYLRKMFYRGKPVRVTWRADLLESHWEE